MNDGTIMTVNGPVPLGHLGKILSHEHLCWNQAFLWSERNKIITNNDISLQPISFNNVGVVRARPYLLRDNLVCDDVDLMVNELSSLKALGIGTIIDVTPIGLGRFPKKLKEISSRTGLHVIAGTGYYHRQSLETNDIPRTITQVEERLITDLTSGIDGTDVRAGIIAEIYLDGGSNDYEQTILEGAIRAHLQTGSTIGFHSSSGAKHNLACLKFLIKRGVSPKNVIFYHMDEQSIAINDIISLARLGAFVSLDRFGYGEFLTLDMESYLPTDRDRIDTILELVNRGFAGQILLSHDLAYKHLLSHYGGYGYTHLLRDVVPILKARGLTDDHIETFFTSNPYRAIT